MPAVARTGDSTSHGGGLGQGSTTLIVNGLSACRVGDPFDCPIHGAQTIASGSPNVENEGKGIARVGDTTTCGASITTGSPNVNAN